MPCHMVHLQLEAACPHGTCSQSANRQTHVLLHIHHVQQHQRYRDILVSIHIPDQGLQDPAARQQVPPQGLDQESGQARHRQGAIPGQDGSHKPRGCFWVGHERPERCCIQEDHSSAQKHAAASAVACKLDMVRNANGCTGLITIAARTQPGLHRQGSARCTCNAHTCHAHTYSLPKSLAKVSRA